MSRVRSSVDYSSEGTSTSAALSVESASKWTIDTTQHLNIRVVDVDIALSHDNLPSEIECLVIPEWTDEEWLLNADIMPYNNKVKALIYKIRTIFVSRRRVTEVVIDGYMDSLLHIVGFDDYPCLMYPQYRYSASIGPKPNNIRATSDFGIITENNKILLVIEDKTTAGPTYANRWKEDQVLGELFVAVHYLAAESRGKPEYPIDAYAIRVINTKFTFYKATATLEYLKESALLGMSEKSEMVVQRYPPVADDPYVLTAYDICKKQDRKCILLSLWHIKKLMLGGA